MTAEPRWLLRSGKHSRYQLQGPMERDEVIRAIKDGKVSLQDEACASGGYWFSFHESEELHKQLGISWNQVRKDALDGDATLHSSEKTDGGSDDDSEDDSEDTDEITLSGTDPRMSAQAAPVQKPLQAVLPGIPPWAWAVVAAVVVALVLRFAD